MNPLNPIPELRRAVRRPLPDRPSALLRLAVSDLRALSRHPRFYIDLRHWYEPFVAQNNCSACLAGAMLLRSAPGNVALEDYMHGYLDAAVEYRDQMYLIDWLRRGEFGAAVQYMAPEYRRRAERLLTLSDTQLHDVIHHEKQLEKMAPRIHPAHLSTSTNREKYLYYDWFAWLLRLARALRKVGL